MLHFVTFYMKQNKSRRQNLESAQYGLEISFKVLRKWKRLSHMYIHRNPLRGMQRILPLK